MSSAGAAPPTPPRPPRRGEGISLPTFLSTLSWLPPAHAASTLSPSLSPSCTACTPADAPRGSTSTPPAQADVVLHDRHLIAAFRITDGSEIVFASAAAADAAAEQPTLRFPATLVVDSRGVRLALRLTHSAVLCRRVIMHELHAAPRVSDVDVPPPCAPTAAAGGAATAVQTCPAVVLSAPFVELVLMPAVAHAEADVEAETEVTPRIAVMHGALEAAHASADDHDAMDDADADANANANADSDADAADPLLRDALDNFLAAAAAAIMPSPFPYDMACRAAPGGHGERFVQAFVAAESVVARAIADADRLVAEALVRPVGDDRLLMGKGSNGAEAAAVEAGAADVTGDSERS